MSDTQPWWHRQNHEDIRPFLIARGKIQTAIRAWFVAEGFIEVDTAILQTSPGNEAHLHAFKTNWRDEATQRETPLYLHTSPEFACKKLLAAGETKIFTFAKVFRNRERGPLHHPEFTMLEWYRAGESYATVMADCESLLKTAAKAADRWDWHFRGRNCDIRQSRQQTTLHQAFQQFAGINLDACFNGNAVDLDAMRREVATIGMRIAADDTWSDLFSRVLAEKIEPRLGLLRPEILSEYPTHEAALARPTAHDPRVAERFELYVCGVELANAFGELTDASEQRRRFDAEMAEKQRLYGERYPIDEDFLQALAQMPPASGAALGFDRLVMLATGAERIEQVLWTPVATA